MKKLNSLASLGLIAGALANNAACGGRTDLPIDYSTNENNPDQNDAGTAGTGGYGGETDAGGAAGTAGSGGEAGIGGTAGSAGTAGEAGMAGSAGEAGMGGQGGTSPEVGTLTISTDYDPGAIVGEELQARMAHFKMEANHAEDQLIEHIRLKVHAVQCDGTGIADPIHLYRKNVATPIAVGTYQDQGGYIGYVDFAFPTPHAVARGDTAFFQVVANQKANCCHFTEETFLEDENDITAKGGTYGLPSTINNQYSENDQHSSVEIWGGSVFVDYYTQQPALNIPVGTANASCLDATVYNCLPEPLELNNLQAQLEITNGDGNADSKDLINNNPPQGNFTGIKLLQRTDTGIPLNTMAGPNELYPAGSDTVQSLQLSGTAIVTPGERANLSLSFNVEQNQALVGNQIRCTLKNLSNDDLVSPVHTIVGQDFPCITVSPSPSPAGGILQPGAQNIEIACWNIQNSCYQTNLMALTAEHYGTGSYDDLHNLGLFMYGHAISDTANFDAAGKVTFTNLTDSNDHDGHNIGSVSSHQLCVHTNVSFSASNGSQHGLQISAPTNLTFNPPTNVSGSYPVQGPTYVIGTN